MATSGKGAEAPRPRAREASGGELNASILRAVVSVYRSYAGRGPTRSQAFFRDNVVVVVMRDFMTPLERTLAEHGRGEAAVELHAQLHEVMRDELVAAVERLTGRTVTALMSDSQADPDVAAEVFVLDRAVVPGARRSSIDGVIDDDRSGARARVRRFSQAPRLPRAQA
jgi:uncharacterized protein YbcI